jgi:tellurite resistance protein TerC
MLPVLLPAFLLPSLGDLGEAVPVILSLIIIEGLLSVDNALAIAAMAAHLPGKQKQRALKFGILGAYLFRGLSLACASWIIEHSWLRLVGSAYLIYLMAGHFAGESEEVAGGEPSAPNSRGFWATIVAIEFMDLSLSVDNVVAAVAMSPKLWVVCTGVFIGILALRFVAGACIRLLEKFPVLEHTAFLLIGYVGGILVLEVLGDPGSGLFVLSKPFHITTVQKFSGILLIVAASLLYARQQTLRKALAPLVRIFLRAMRGVAFVLGLPFQVLMWPVRRIRGA